MVDGSDRASAVVVRFNDFINSSDIDGLAGLMSDDHVFIDTAGDAVTGKRACVEAWRGFFDAFPGYRNLFESVRANDDVVTVVGRSVCPGHPILEGPALWSAIVAGDCVTQWRVHNDTAEARERLGLA